MVHDLLKRTHVRMALSFAVLFAVSVALLFSALLFRAKGELEEGIKLRAERTRDALVAIDRRFGFDELVNVVNEEAESLRDSDNIFELLGSDGAVHAGNVRGVTPFEGWRILPRSSLPEVAGEGLRQDKFFAIWTPVSKGQLLIGRSDREERQSRLILIRSLGWGLLATSVFAIGAGVYLARGTQRRIADIGDTLASVASGHLGRRVSIVGSGDDLDEVATSLNAMLTKLQRLVENVNQVSTDIAHDLKKPMMRLRQRLETLRDDPKVTPATSARITECLEAADSIVATFEALLSIGQLQAGGHKDRFQPVDLAAVLRDVAGAYEPVAQDAGFVLEIAVPDAALLIYGDAQLLMQALANLIDNSLRHCPSGTRIAVSLSRNDRDTLLTVADTGPGIPPQARELVFRRFYRLERARASPGHGLGLSVVSAIAELHSASVELTDNAPGTRITLAFPRHADRVPHGEVAPLQKL
jgi:signal transduction histidine kinase